MFASPHILVRRIGLEHVLVGVLAHAIVVVDDAEQHQRVHSYGRETRSHGVFDNAECAKQPSAAQCHRSPTVLGFSGCGGSSLAINVIS